MWLPSENTIIVQSHLPAVLERVTLSHEIGHARFGHTDDRPKHEKQADRYAVRNLIDTQVFLSSPNCFQTSFHDSEMANELGVTLRILRIFLHDVDEQLAKGPRASEFWHDMESLDEYDDYSPVRGFV